MDTYTIDKIVGYRKIDWKLSNEFFYLTEIPTTFEPFTMYPNYYSFGILHKGSMTLEIDNCLHYIDTKSFLIYRPDQTLKIISIEPETTGAFILFTRRFIQNFQPSFDTFFTNTFLHNTFDSHIIIEPKDHDYLSVMFNKIFELLSSIYTDRWEISARNLISTLINETDIIFTKYKSTKEHFSVKETDFINKFKILARENFKKEKQIAFYLSKLNISISQLYKIFKKQGQQSPSIFLNNLLLQEAKFLLSTSEDNISEIAYQLSFTDIHTFSRFFKKHTAFSPSEFRRTNSAMIRKDKY